jgi:hypothetical protein
MIDDRYGLARNGGMRRDLAIVSRRLNDRWRRFIVMRNTVSELSMIQPVRGQPHERE